jgi:hypothetical protein
MLREEIAPKISSPSKFIIKIIANIKNFEYKSKYLNQKKC